MKILSLITHPDVENNFCVQKKQNNYFIQICILRVTLAPF